MTSFRFSLTALAISTACGLTSTSWGQVNSASNIGPLSEAELYRRLNAAEQRINDLESQRLPQVGMPGDVYRNASSASAVIERRVAELERRLAEDEKKEVEKYTRTEVVAKSTQKWFGRIHADYWAFPDSDATVNQLETGNPNADPLDRFLFRRARIGVGGDIHDTMNYKIEMEFANPSKLAFKDAYIGWKELPGLQTMLLGIQKRPYGLDHLNSSRYNVFMERPYVIEAFNQDTRRFGLASYGVTDNERWNWRCGTFLSDDQNQTGIWTQVDDGNARHSWQAEVAGRLANTIWYDECSDGRGYAHWAVAGTYGVPDAESADNVARWTTRPEARSTNKWFDTGSILGATNYNLAAIEAVFNVGALQVVGEYQYMTTRRFGPNTDLNFHGGYAYVSYFLTGEHVPWDRRSGTIGRTEPFENFFLVRGCDGKCAYGLGAWQLAARYSYGDFTDEDIQGGVGQSVTLGLNWWWTPYSRLQFNYLFGEIEKRDGLPEGSYGILGARFMVDW